MRPVSIRYLTTGQYFNFELFARRGKENFVIGQVQRPKSKGSSEIVTMTVVGLAFQLPGETALEIRIKHHMIHPAAWNAEEAIARFLARHGVPVVAIETALDRFQQLQPLNPADKISHTEGPEWEIFW